MKTTKFIFNNGADLVPMQGNLALKFSFLGFDFEVVKVQKYYYILCEGIYIYANTNDYKTALEVQMYFIDKCTLLKTSAKDIRKFIDERKEIQN